MSAVALWMSQRGRIAVVLSLCFVWAAYYLWTTGDHESLIITPPSWAVGEKAENTSSSNPNIVNLDEISNLNDHFALHTHTYAVTTEAKASNVNHDDYDNHFAFHTHTFLPTAPAAKAQVTPVESTNASPVPTLAMAEFDPFPIRKLCEQTSWHLANRVIINCEGRVGGVGNVKQEILVCVRHAIEIGASLMRPTIMLRSEGLIEYQHGPIHDMGYMFDLETFNTRLRISCPLLAIYPDMRTLEKHGRRIIRVQRPRDLPEEEGRRLTPKEWAEKNLAKDEEITMIDYPLIMGQTCIHPLLISEQDQANLFVQRPVCQDDAAFVTNFGKLLEIQTDAKLLAARALLELATRFGFSPATANGVLENAFVGVHLRTEVDAINVGYASYENQAAASLEYINSTSLRVVYAASGNTTSLQLFAEAANALSPPAKVFTKWDLLSGADNATLSSMTWDQQALVDFLILERSSKFAGVSESSFSWDIAYKRQIFSDVGPCTMNSTQEMTDDDGIVYEDSLSKLSGRQDDFFVDKMYP